jgi:hypothetical protein
MAGNMRDDIDKSSDAMRTPVSDALAYMVWGEFPLALVGGLRSHVIA